MSNPFDYVNAILQNKKQLIVDEITEKDYNPFLTNRSLSYHKDCIMYANEMNRRHFVDKKLQNDFLLNTVRSQKLVHRCEHAQHHWNNQQQNRPSSKRNTLTEP